MENLAIFDLEIIPCIQCEREEETEVGVINDINGTTEFPENFSWNAEQIHMNQEEDPQTSLNFKATTHLKACLDNILAENEELKTYCCLWDQLNIRNGILYKFWVVTKIWQVVTPKEIAEEGIKELHDHVTG